MRITLLTDFGDEDGYVGAMKGVIATIAPEAPVADPSHGIRRGDIAQAAYVLAQAAPHWPARTVHVVVVDPGVGTARRAIAASLDDQIYVAPDNGVLTQVLAGAQGPVGAVELTNDAFWRQPVSHTFHGRDVFAPCAAYLCAHVPLEALGRPADPATLVRLPSIRPTVSSDEAVGEVVHIDGFGNAVTNLGHAALDPLSAEGRTVQVLVGGQTLALCDAYAAVAAGEPLAIVGSGETLEIAVNAGSAAERLGLAVGTQVVLRAR